MKEMQDRSPITGKREETSEERGWMDRTRESVWCSSWMKKTKQKTAKTKKRGGDNERKEKQAKSYKMMNLRLN